MPVLGLSFHCWTICCGFIAIFQGLHFMELICRFIIKSLHIYAMQLFFGTYKNIKTHKWLELNSVGLAYSCSSTPPFKISHGHLFTILCASGFAALIFFDNCDVSLMSSEISTKTE